MRVLIVEDDAQTADFIAEGLTGLGHEIDRSDNGHAALAALGRHCHDIVILDRLLPGMDGLQVVKQMRAEADTTPVLMLTALGQIRDRVNGLEAGADDYLVKPFDLSELAARLTAIMRRRSVDPNLTTLAAGRLRMDVLHREVRFDDRPIALQPRETRLLEELMRNAGNVVTRLVLLDKIWGFQYIPPTNLVDTHVSRLRTKLAVNGVTTIIETVRGAGYRLRIEDGL